MNFSAYLAYKTSLKKQSNDFKFILKFSLKLNSKMGHFNSNILASALV